MGQEGASDGAADLGERKIIAPPRISRAVMTKVSY
jgi:hypothetical protein